MKDLAQKTETGVTAVVEAAASFVESVSKVIVGKKEVLELMFVALLSEGHILLEDVPGIGKTTLARAIARSLGCSFKRIQFTPDLLPSDVTGIHFFNQKNSEFEFRPGPIIANIVLADEINRATPRTQSCLLECMQEQQVTVDLETVSLPRPFLVMATQNPIELEGTFPLPEAQLDRFMMKIGLGYPTEAEEGEILERFRQENPMDTLTSVIEGKELMELQWLCRRVFVSEAVRGYIIALSSATRSHPSVQLGASPRASLSVSLAAQALAAIRGRDYVLPDDVKYLAVPALAHRIIARSEARLRGQTTNDIIKEIVEQVPVPVEEVKQS